MLLDYGESYDLGNSGLSDARISSDVRFGSKADIQRRLTNVRFTPKSGH